MDRVQVRYSGSKLVIAAAIAALLGTDVEAAPAGTVDFATGNVVATGIDGRARKVVKGAELNAGDRIVTNDGRAQIRFTDGAYVSLQPDTDFSIREYRFDGKTDGTERGLFGLLKGAMRTVTGAIGRVNRNAYQIQTPTATIGIRGTGGLIQILGGGGTLLIGNSGSWLLTALNKETIEVPAGQAAQTLPDPQKGPEKVAQGPVIPPPQPALLPKGQKTPDEPSNPLESGGPGQGNAPGGGVIAAGDQVTTTGEPAGVVAPAAANQHPPLVTGSGYDLSVASGGVAPWTQNEGQTFATFDATGQLIDSNGPSGKLTINGSHAEFKTVDGIMAWGRWTGVTSTVTAIPSQTYAQNDGLHYVVGIPAPIGALAGTGTATFNLIGATSPTDGTNAGSVTGGQLVVNLGAAPTVNLQNLTVAIAGSTYVMSKAAMPITGPMTPFAGTLSGFGGGGDFAGSSGGCSSMCSATVNGHFYGSGATHAGIAYKLTDTFPTSRTVTGAAAFAR
jgi:hypothetical protein